MKLLVSTTASQGQLSSDFCWVPEGEIVIPQWMSCSNRCTCGCARSWMGIDCRRGTTTAEIVDHPIDLDELIRRVQVSWTESGFGAVTEAEATDHIADVIALVQRNNVGDLVRIEGEHVAVLSKSAYEGGEN